ncbi:MAG TPA: YbjN domain-containing protein [Kofleriaceae bacterium]|nr:YbjN domain-containing protein [Kofleriaceae bacterium]
MGALELVADYFKQQKWTFEAAEDRPVLRLPFEHKGEVWTCYAEVREEQQRVIFYTVPPLTVPEPQRRAMAELITRANFGLAVGNFELDFTDGELRCKTSIDVTGDRLSHALLHQLVVANLRLVRHYLPAVRALLAGATPFDAINRAGG